MLHHSHGFQLPYRYLEQVDSVIPNNTLFDTCIWEQQMLEVEEAEEEEETFSSQFSCAMVLAM